MSEKQDDRSVTAEENEKTTRRSTMAESEETQEQQSQQEEQVKDQKQEQEQKQQQEINKKFQKMSISLSIWPPTQRTRDAVINRLIETLTAPSILSNRYGSLPPDEAKATARLIEEEAFATATAAAAASSPDNGAGSAGTGVSIEDDGIEILQIYSKEISKRMLDAVKAKAAATASAAAGGAPPGDAPQTPPVSAAPGAGEEISSFESETS